MMRRGRPRVAETTAQLPTVTVPAALKRRLQEIADEKGVPLATVVRTAVFLHLKNRQSETTVHTGT